MVKLKLESRDLQLCSSFPKLFVDPLHFHMNSMSISAKKGSWNFNQDCIESVYQFGEYCHLNSIESSIQETFNFFQQYYVFFKVQSFYLFSCIYPLVFYSFWCCCKLSYFINFIFKLFAQFPLTRGKGFVLSRSVLPSVLMCGVFSTVKWSTVFSPVLTLSWRWLRPHR